jgi:hypothetical protein
MADDDDYYPTTPEEMEEITQQRIARDDDYAAIDLAIGINRSIEDTPAWRYILARAQFERDEALAKLAEIPPHDQNAIRSLQHRARFITVLQLWLQEVDERAKTAHEKIKREDGLLPSDTA